MKTMRLDPSTRERAALVTGEIEQMLAAGKSITVTLAEAQELLSPQQAADRLGFSRQHVVRLIGYGDLQGQKLPGSTHWKIPLSSVLAFEAQRADHERLTAAWSSELNVLGTPAE